MRCSKTILIKGWVAICHGAICRGAICRGAICRLAICRQQICRRQSADSRSADKKLAICQRFIQNIIRRGKRRRPLVRESLGARSTRKPSLILSFSTVVIAHR